MRLHRHDYEMEFTDASADDPFAYRLVCSCGDTISTMAETIGRQGKLAVITTQEERAMIWKIVKGFLAIIGFLFVIMLMRAANAEGLVVSCGDSSCIIAPALSAEAKVISVPSNGYDPKWVAFCKPHVVRVDDLGAQYLGYAHKGCEHGRTE
jgi:hypothetical protein